MKIYKVEYADQRAGHQGFGWYSSKAEAKSAIAYYMRTNKPEKGDDYYDQLYARKTSPDRPTLEEVVVNPTKAGILSLLRRYATHPDNG